jgi:hypothetical protein
MRMDEVCGLPSQEVFDIRGTIPASRSGTCKSQGIGAQKPDTRHRGGAGHNG